MSLYRCICIYGIDYDEIAVEIARNCSGDVRSAINDLQLLTQGVGKVSKKDLEILGERDREGNIFNAIRTILKTKDFHKSRDSLKNLHGNLYIQEMKCFLFYFKG